MTIVTVDFRIKDMISPAIAFEASNVYFGNDGYVSTTWAIDENCKIESTQKWKEVLKFREIIKHYDYTEAKYGKLGNLISCSSKKT